MLFTCEKCGEYFVRNAYLDHVAKQHEQKVLSEGFDKNKEAMHILDQLDAGIFQLIRARTRLANIVKRKEIADGSK